MEHRDIGIWYTYRHMPTTKLSCNEITVPRMAEFRAWQTVSLPLGLSWAETGLFQGSGYAYTETKTFYKESELAITRFFSSFFFHAQPIAAGQYFFLSQKKHAHIFYFFYSAANPVRSKRRHRVMLKILSSRIIKNLEIFCNYVYYAMRTLFYFFILSSTYRQFVRKLLNDLTNLLQAMLC